MFSSSLSTIHDEKTTVTYRVGKYLGKGGFGICYEIIDERCIFFAGKFISKASASKYSDFNAKLRDEIGIHHGLNHENIVKFHSSFEDNLNVYIVLELCHNKSLYELHKRRKHITEPETRFFCRQIAKACEYLHQQRIIHRDLKLANCLLGNNLIVKVSDFGLSSRITKPGERRKTRCGTADYIAPEILKKEGHSFEVDSWSLGCIIYILLVGTPPFGSETVKETYGKIVRNEYSISIAMHSSTQHIIKSALQKQVSLRPSMTALLKMDFFQQYIPTSLPLSVLSTEPCFTDVSLQPKPMDLTRAFESMNINPTVSVKPSIQHLKDLQKLLRLLLSSKNILPNVEKMSNFKVLQKSESPKLDPVFWVSKWIDFTERYGVGYQLNDGSSGLLFNDVTTLLEIKNNQRLQYIDIKGNEKFIKPNEQSVPLAKKIKLLEYFEQYMDEHLVKTGDNMKKSANDTIGRLPYMLRFLRSKLAIVMYLSNGTFQINFLSDHVKIILCPVMNAMTYVENSECRTYCLDQMRLNGYSDDISVRLKHAYERVTSVETLLTNQS